MNSKVTKTLLTYFFLHSDENLYINEMVRKFRLDKRNLAKKLKEFEKEGLFKSEKRGNQIYYSLNKRYALYDEYRKIVLKTTGIESQLENILKGIDGIKKAYILGSYARNKMDSASDIDLLVIGSANTINVHKKLAGLQERIDREINLINMSEKEFEIKKKENDPFIKDVFKKKRIEII